MVLLIHSSLFLSYLCFSYEVPQIALRCGIMLRECIRHEPLAKIILFSDQFQDFFKYVELSTFDIASDAFATFKVIPCLSPTPPHTQPESAGLFSLST